MRHAATDETSRMAQPQPGGVHRAGFESTLPPEARTEMLRRTTQPPGRVAKTKQTRHVFPWTVGLVAVLAWVIGAALSSHQASTSPQSVAPPIMVPTPAVPAPTPRGVVPLPAPRAELVTVTVKRAERVPQLGKWNQVWMPENNGSPTWIRFWGVKNTFADLPSDPQIGDAFGVLEGGQHALWVWYQLPNHSQPAWVDP